MPNKEKIDYSFGLHAIVDESPNYVVKDGVPFFYFDYRLPVCDLSDFIDFVLDKLGEIHPRAVTEKAREANREVLMMSAIKEATNMRKRVNEFESNA